MAYIPLKDINNIDSLKNRLTVPYYKQVMVDEDDDTNRITMIPCYDISKKGYIGVPREFARKNFSHLNFVDRTSWPEPFSGESYSLIDYDGCINPRDEKQKEFMDSLANVCSGDGIIDCIANAKTGSGKTVTDLWLNIKLGVPTLVVVPTNNIKEQWKGNIKRKQGLKYFFGEEFVNKYVGIVQQDECDYKGKLVVIGMIHSLSRRDYGKDFYRYFGKVTIDEVHKCATPVLSRALMRFPQRIRLGFTATNKSGALRKICDFHLGKPQVKSEQEVLKPIVYICRFEANVDLWGEGEHQLLYSLANYKRRNQSIAKLIYKRGYKRNRNVIVFSDKVKQLQTIGDLLFKMGIPAKEIGLYVGAKYLRNGKGGFLKKTEKVQEKQLDAIANRCSIILTTYGKFGTGGDIARLDMAVEALPSRVDLVQAVGRIVRTHEGKLQPEWYTIKDEIEYHDDSSKIPEIKKYPFLKKKYKSRIKSLRKTGASFKRVVESI